MVSWLPEISKSALALRPAFAPEPVAVNNAAPTELAVANMATEIAIPNTLLIPLTNSLRVSRLSLTVPKHLCNRRAN